MKGRNNMTALHLRKSIGRSLRRYGVGSGIHRKLCLMTVIFSMFAGTASGHPTGWVYFAGSQPYLWSQDANGWAYMSPNGTQWTYDFNTHQWTTLSVSGASAWAYFLWPYVFKQNPDNSWTSYYFDESSGSMLWLYNFGTAGWELMNSPLPFVCCLPPARDILGTWTGSGSYIDYTCDFNTGDTIQNALVNAAFTFFFFDPGDGSTVLVATANPLSWTQLAPTEDFIPPVFWGNGATAITISSSRWWCHVDVLDDAWSFNFTTNTMAGSITRDPGVDCCNNGACSFVGVDSTGLNGIALTKQSN